MSSDSKTMRISRGLLLKRLDEASVGLSGTKEIIEQSHSFVFQDGKLITFNGDVMVRTESPLNFDVVINASTLMGLLSKIPDEEVDITLNEGELRVKGKKREAGITTTTKVDMPIDAVPTPDKYHRLSEGTMSIMQQAAETCGQDETQLLTTYVHITPNRIEACDNYRLFRVDDDTGFPGEVLIPASSINAIRDLEVKKVAVGEGWVHFKTKSGSEISVRSANEKYPTGIDALLKMDHPASLTLPATLKEIVERAEVFNTAAYDSKVGIRIEDGQLYLTSQKDGGWYKERKRLQYTGKPLSFDINPKFLVETLKRNPEVEVDEHKMKIVSGRIQFVVVLTAKAEKEE